MTYLGKKNRNAYRTWISEIMLQQTQVVTVIPYYQRFIKQFPNVSQLAQTKLDQVLKLWTGLGYYARARHLHKTAQIIHQQHANRFPRSIEQLCALPGIGRSTAGAILSFAFDLPTPILDGNVKRVLARFFAVAEPITQSKTLKQLWQIASDETPHEKTAIYNQAIMDLGANICTRGAPRCEQCPLQKKCSAYQQQQVTQFPVRQAKPQLPQKKIVWLLLQKPNQQILLEKRPPVGIWGGLWSFPECQTQLDVADYCEQRWGYQIKHLRTLPDILHTFSHFRLKITPIKGTVVISKKMRIRDAIPDHYWHNMTSDLPGGIPAPVKKLLLES